MHGSLYYAIGQDFDPRQELRDLKARVAAEDRHRGYFSAVRLLFDLAVDGFDPEQMNGLLESTNNTNVMLFEDSGVRLAFDLPGHGRLQTADIILLAAQFCPLRGGPAHAISLTVFVETASERRLIGTRATWHLVKPK
jgi:hypothetical protein